MRYLGLIQIHLQLLFNVLNVPVFQLWEVQKC